jgi:hypothetical protein
MRNAARLACLVVGIAGLPVFAGAQGNTPYPLDSVEHMIASRMRPGRVLGLVQGNCLAFVMDSVAGDRLAKAGAQPSLIRSLGDICYKGPSLEVTSDPPSAGVTVNGRASGRTPWVSPVAPRSGVRIAVSTGAASREALIDIAAHESVRIHFVLPQDTIPHGTYTPPQSGPTRPSRLKSWILGGLAGAAAGLGIGAIACKSENTTYQYDPNGDTWTATGTSNETEGGCVAGTTAVGTLAVGFVANRWVNRSYQKRRREWEQSNQGAGEPLVDRPPDATKFAQIIANNQRIIKRNKSLPQPVIERRPARQLPKATPSP